MAAMTGVADRLQVLSLDSLEGMRLHGLDLSYFTGKLQAYLRYVELPFEFVEMTAGGMREVAKATGIAQMPAIELRDGRWMTDTTAIIEWVEQRRSANEVIPKDPVQRFFSLLLEDYADEWLWRPALHYRWSFEPDTRLMGHRIATEMLRDIPLPLFVRRMMIIQRQKAKYVRGDGITAGTRQHVEDIYRRNLEWLEAIFKDRPYLLGDRPTLADFGFMGPMFRHFSLDPTPAKIMRDTAPLVFAWVGRMWSIKASHFAKAGLQEGIPADWDPVLRDMASCYFPYLAANADAAANGLKKFSVTLEGCAYILPTNLNRVHCLSALHAAFQRLEEDAAVAVRQRLERHGAWEPLWRVRPPDIGFDPDGRLPFLTPDTAWATGAVPKRIKRSVYDGADR